jgi:hypothetical protein
VSDDILSPKTMQALLERVAGGESLTNAEQRKLISSHERVRARWLVNRNAASQLRRDLDAERARLNYLVRGTVEKRRDDNEPRPSARRRPL